MDNSKWMFSDVPILFGEWGGRGGGYNTMFLGAIGLQ